MDRGNHCDCEQRWDPVVVEGSVEPRAPVSGTVSFAVVSVDRDKVCLAGEILLPLYQRKLLPLFTIFRGNSVTGRRPQRADERVSSRGGLGAGKLREQYLRDMEY
ncbi:hypothetical protein QLX08_002276 [Tetragonisca angustula]|uniref:Uncharacterized protein n=1 Tax=Tetragonisca angustula TaxID=166442 RepID=A0AAW1AC81_9HYME